jgi:hypothetical protein
VKIHKETQSETESRAIYEADWLAAKPIFYNDKTLKISHNVNDVIDSDSKLVTMNIHNGVAIRNWVLDGALMFKISTRYFAVIKWLRADVIETKKVVLSSFSISAALVIGLRIVKKTTFKKRHQAGKAAVSIII